MAAEKEMALTMRSIGKEDKQAIFRLAGCDLFYSSARFSSSSMDFAFFAATVLG